MSLAAATSQLTLDRVHDVDAVLPVWSRLAARSGNLFATPEWLLGWWRHLGRGELELWLARDGGDPRALLPLFLRDGELRFLGDVDGDQLGPVCAPADRAAAGAALGRLLDGDAIPWTAFAGRDLPEDVPWAELTGATVVRRTASPVLDLEGLDWETYLATRSRNLRAQARTIERRLAGRACVRTADDPARLQEDVDTLFALHEARWDPRDADSLVRHTAPFHREFAATALERGWLRLRVLEIDDRPAAALLSFRFGGDEWFYQSGRDPALRRESPGLALHLHAIRAALDDGLRAYRLLRGDEPYKLRLADRNAGVVDVRRERGAG